MLGNRIRDSLKIQGQLRASAALEGKRLQSIMADMKSGEVRLYLFIFLLSNREEKRVSAPVKQAVAWEVKINNMLFFASGKTCSFSEMRTVFMCFLGVPEFQALIITEQTLNANRNHKNRISRKAETSAQNRRTSF